MKKLSILASAAVLAVSASTSMAAVFPVGGSGTQTTYLFGVNPIGTGNWTIDSGTYDDGTGIVDFTFSGHMHVSLGGYDADLVGNGVLDTIGNTFTVTFSECVGDVQICDGAAVGTPNPADSINITTMTSTQIAFTASDSDPGTSTNTEASWDVQVVPVPAAAWLFGSALLGLAGVGRRRAA